MPKFVNVIHNIHKFGHCSKYRPTKYAYLVGLYLLQLLYCEALIGCPAVSKTKTLNIIHLHRLFQMLQKSSSVWVIL